MEVYKIESTEEAEALFEEFLDQYEQVDLESASGHDGQKILTLIIDNLPAVVAAVSALIAVLKGKGISFNITKDGVKVDAIDKP